MKRNIRSTHKFASRLKTLTLNKKTLIVGEKINPTNKPDLQKELKKESFELVRELALDELSQGADLLDINVICPGPVHSNIVKEAPWLLRHILKGIFWVVFRSPAKASRAVVYLALSKDYEGTSNEYLHMFNPKRMDPKVYDEEEGRKLWDRSMDLLEELEGMR